MRIPIRLLLSLATALAVAPVARAQVRVALCGAASASSTACQWTSPQSLLQATGWFATVDILNVTTGGIGTPTLAQLLQYDALLCYTNTTPADHNAWGDVLADYVDAGGGVVVAVFANSTLTAGRNIGGRWQNGYEVILDQGGTASGGGAGLGTVHVPGHPVMAGVTAFTGGTIGSRPLTAALEVGSFVVAEWTDGRILVAQGASPQRVDLGFYPPQAACSQSGWATGGELLMANALLSVANGATFGPFGTGCVGALGVPTLAAQPGSRPLIGGTLDVDLDGLPLSVGLIGLGTSNTQSGALTLPFDLAPIGMPGCQLLIDPAVTLLVAGPGSTAAWSLPIPNDPSLLFVVLFAQGFSLDPNANAFGFTTANAGRIKIGL